MNDAELNRLLDLALRKPLTIEEETRLQTHFAADRSASAHWQDETDLTRLLAGLPNARLSSNFTAQVTQTLKSNKHRYQHASSLVRWLGLHRPVRQFAAACVVLAFTMFAFIQHQSFRREKMAVAVASVAGDVDRASDIAGVPAIEMLQDFDAIVRLPAAQPRPDEELLAGLVNN